MLQSSEKDLLIFTLFHKSCKCNFLTKKGQIGKSFDSFFHLCLFNVLNVCQQNMFSSQLPGRQLFFWKPSQHLLRSSAQLRPNQLHQMVIPSDSWILDVKQDLNDHAKAGLWCHSYKTGEIIQATHSHWILPVLPGIIKAVVSSFKAAVHYHPGTFQQIRGHLRVFYIKQRL